LTTDLTNIDEHIGKVMMARFPDKMEMAHGVFQGQNKDGDYIFYCVQHKSTFTAPVIAHPNDIEQ